MENIQKPTASRAMLFGIVGGIIGSLALWVKKQYQFCPKGNQAWSKLEVCVPYQVATSL